MLRRSKGWSFRLTPSPLLQIRASPHRPPPNPHLPRRISERTSEFFFEMLPFPDSIYLGHLSISLPLLVTSDFMHLNPPQICIIWLFFFFFLHFFFLRCSKAPVAFLSPSFYVNADLFSPVIFCPRRMHAYPPLLISSARSLCITVLNRVLDLLLEKRPGEFRSYRNRVLWFFLLLSSAAPHVFRSSPQGSGRALLSICFFDFAQCSGILRVLPTRVRDSSSSLIFPPPAQRA